MASIFTDIIEGRAPARMIWTDDRAVAFLTIEPRQPGHTLVVPRLEVDRWLDLPEELMAHLMSIAHQIGLAQRQEWSSDRVGLMIEGYMVPHVHVHIWPSWSPFEFHPTGIDRAARPAALDEAAVRLRSRLRALGHGDRVPPE
ncbi:HIT family protein [Parafrigoribacterium soli]|uniref:HIT family protein n=1 Tax=Parafrigoribacterium soli TaxID=3144663 RepID=UPI0032EBBC66